MATVVYPADDELALVVVKNSLGLALRRHLDSPMHCGSSRQLSKQETLNRRQFIGGALGVATSAVSLATLSTLAADTPPPEAKPVQFPRKIKLGVIGNGGRGSWIAGLFQKHGGYELWAVADYFQEVADQCGDKLGVDKSRCFSTLSGYKRLFESGVEAVALETPPYFFPEHASAAVEAGLHVYHGQASGGGRARSAWPYWPPASAPLRRKLCFLVDYQVPTDPHNIEVAKQIAAGQIGKPAVITSRYFGGGWPDPPRTATQESRFQRLIWCNDIALGGSHHVNACIHTIDAVLWALGQRPVSAVGYSHIARDNPHSDSHDVLAVSYAFADGVVWDHCGRHLNNLYPFESGALIHGTTGFAELSYTGRARLKGSESAYSGDVTDLYEAGAVRNIAEFHRCIAEGKVR